MENAEKKRRKKRGCRWGEREARTRLRRLDGGEMEGRRWTRLRRLAARDGRLAHFGSNS